MKEESILKNGWEIKAKPFYRSYKLLILILILVLLFPYKTLEVPEWKVTFLDEEGKPVSEVNANQEWKSYTFGQESREDRITNNEGVIVFPEITMRMPLLFRFIISIKSYALIFLHGSVGSHASIQGRSGERIFYEHEFGKNPTISLGIYGTGKVVTTEKLETTFRNGSKPIY